MHGPDIPQIEVQPSMERIREAASTGSSSKNSEERIGQRLAC